MTSNITEDTPPTSDTKFSHNSYAPDYAAIATKAAFSMWALWDTPYTDLLYGAISDLFDPANGYYEGLLELGGGPIQVFTANNNGILLAALLYKAEGKILTPPKEKNAEVWFTQYRDTEIRERHNLPDPPPWLTPASVSP